jgi:3-methyladenine DNA glycosylase Tag
MQHFDQIYERASARKGGDQALQGLLDPIREPIDLAALSDAEVLAEMTACVFRAGFVWKVITAKWPGFEKAFDGFDVTQCAMLSDEEIEELSSNTDIVRHRTKIVSVRANALYILDIRAEHGNFGTFLESWPSSDFVGLWSHLKKNGSRLGGQTGRYCLRFLGYDTPILSRDVVAALISAGVVDKEPTSKRGLAATQDAFNIWREQSNRSAREISRILALSVG